MKAFKIYCGQTFYAFAAKTKDEAINKFNEDIGDDYTEVIEILESDWDEKNITIREDNDLDNKPFKISIRESIIGNEPQMLSTNDSAMF